MFDILSLKRERKNEAGESVKWPKDAKLEDLEDVLVIWLWHRHTDSGTAADEALKGQAKVLQ
jgi:hypothetical protein